MELVAVPRNKFPTNLIKFNLITLNLLNRQSDHGGKDEEIQELEQEGICSSSVAEQETMPSELINF